MGVERINYFLLFRDIEKIIMPFLLGDFGAGSLLDDGTTPGPVLGDDGVRIHIYCW